VKKAIRITAKVVLVGLALSVGPVDADQAAGRFSTLSTNPKLPAKPAITGYSQDEHSVSVTVASLDSANTSYVILPKVPSSLNLESFRRQSRAANVIDGKVVIRTIDEPATGEYSIFIFVQDHFVELVRQSANWLQRAFDFDRPGGYTILGRRSLEANLSDPIEHGALVFVGKPRQLKFTPVWISQFPEINDAAGLLRLMWSSPIQKGPTAESHVSYQEQGFEEKLRRLRAGEFAVMCSGFRDLFVHASTGTDRFKVRPIEAYNYYPQIPELITYSHSATEIWVEELSKWVLFDPWLGIMITKNGTPIGAAELRESTEADVLSLLTVMEQMPVMHRNGDGQTVFSSMKPSSINVKDFVCVEAGCSPAYVEYFRNFIVRGFRVVSTAIGSH